MRKRWGAVVMIWMHAAFPPAVSFFGRILGSRCLSFFFVLRACTSHSESVLSVLWVIGMEMFCGVVIGCNDLEMFGLLAMLVMILWRAGLGWDSEGIPMQDAVLSEFLKLGYCRGSSLSATFLASSSGSPMFHLVIVSCEVSNLNSHSAGDPLRTVTYYIRRWD